MKYLPINQNLFVQNRANLAAKLKPNSIAIFNSNDIMPTNADGQMLFRQNNDLFYFSSIDQEDTILVLFPDAPKPEWKEILFIKETNEKIIIWEGTLLTKDEAKNASGIQTVFWLSEFENFLPQLVFEAEYIYLNSNEHVRSSNEVQTRDSRFLTKIQQNFPLHKLERLAPILNALRSVKHKIEIELIRIAIDITAKAFDRTLKFIKKDVYEYEIEAEITHEFIRNRATRHAYTPIIASGSNACILHYTQNNQILKDGDLILLDFGAEYANYAADLTRTIPINGKFVNRQKQVYNAVLHIQNAAKAMLLAGNDFEIYNKHIGKIVEQELIKLNLLSKEDVAKQDEKNPLYKKFYMHGTSHFLGLDVHDVGTRFTKFCAGMILTCEPGIYIPNENLGIRLENNILITEDGNVDLTENIPIIPEDIENLIGR